MDRQIQSGPESHWAGATIFRQSVAMSGGIDILVIPYQELDSTRKVHKDVQTRLSGGGNRHGESYAETLRRELRDELSDELMPFSLPDSAVSMLFKKDLPGNLDKGGGVHTKIFYAVEFKDMVCALRKDKDHHEPDGTILGIPFWLDSEDAVRRMEEERTPCYHILAVLELVRTLAEISEDVEKRYANLLASRQHLKV